MTNVFIESSDLDIGDGGRDICMNKKKDLMQMDYL